MKRSGPHVPDQDTSAVQIQSFATALLASEEPNDAYDVHRWLYVPPMYTEYRYILGTRGEKPLIVVGINPSTAEPNALDPTVASAERIALNNGYDSFLMFNVYAQRATHPNDMERKNNQILHAENMKAFQYLLSLHKENPPVWAAWGTVIEKRPYLKQCLFDMLALGKKANARWFKAGNLTKAGHPRHPLYMRKDTLLDSFDIETYLAALYG
ncbi:MAG TPA: DUF1643 domain-containing protein [Clostridiaceae bacterium]|nr:DUF1643 domain-containing protein [Clostridiaceae bacterium]